MARPTPENGKTERKRVLDSKNGMMAQYMKVHGRQGQLAARGNSFMLMEIFMRVNF